MMNTQATEESEDPEIGDDRRISITPKGCKFVELIEQGIEWEEALRQAEAAFPSEKVKDR